MKFLWYLCLFILINSFSYGQLTFTNNPSATALAQNVVGFGVTVTNASLTCASGASAIFGNGASTTLGLTNGILLTTGTASLVANGAGNGFGGLFPLSVANGTGGDALMDGLTGGAGTSFDRCKLEFDITAQCSNLLINYKFGSEEYPDYVGSNKNDAFGFFISGVNPAGGNYTNFNMATVPNTSLPVNINNVNNGVNNSGPCTNCAYYVNNSGSANIEYDGITTLLTASANITPCANYHLILEIADGGDTGYDSGVFLQFGGLSCPTPTITTSSSPSSCTANTGSAGVTVTGVVPATYSWSPGGQTTSGITNQAAGTYTCTITFTNGVCAPIIQTRTITITSPGVSPTVAVSSNTPCAGSTLSLTATSNGNGYTWSGPNSFSSTNQNPTIAGATAAASGVYTLVVTNAGGCSKTTTLNVTLAPPPSLTVTSGATCLGGSVTLTAGGATNYTWSPGGATTSSITVSPTTTVIYTVTGATGACIGTGTSTVSITGSPTVAVNSGSLCTGNTITLTATGAANYTWSPATGLSTTSGSVVIANPTITTVYSILGANGSCTATAGSTVNVTTTPTVSVNSGSICSGSSLALNASGASTYSWSPSTALSTSTGSTVSANPNTTTVYTVTGFNGSCTATVSSTVNVTTTPTVSVNSTSICSGNSATLTAGGATNYTWSPATDLSTTSGSVVIANPTITTVYSILGANGSCTATAGSTVNVTTTPTVSVNSGSICSGSSLALNASGASTYSWSPSTALSTSTGSNVSANPNTTTVYTVTGSNGSCTATASSTVNVTTTPTVNVNSASICSGSSATLTAGGATNYTWSPATGLSTTSGSVVIANPTITTVYSILGANGSCTATANSTVNVTTTPTVSVNSGSICSGSSIALNANGATNYTWSPSTALSTSTGSNVSANPNTTTVYTVTGANGSCTATVSSTVSVTTTPTVSVNSASICSGSSATLTATGAANYTWSPAGTLSAGTGSVVTANPMSTTVYSVIGANNSCTATANSTVNVTITPTLSATSATICSGSAASLTVTGAANYTWSPSSSLSSATGSVVTANPALTQTYSITGAVGTCTNVTTTTVNVNITPTVSVNSASICSGSSATLTANGATNYTWNPVSNLSASTGSVVVANPNATTVYSVLGETAGCASTVITTVSVTTTPTLALTGSDICFGQTSATLIAAGAANYTWSPSGSLNSSVGGTVVANPAATTSYSVLGANGSCTNTAIITVSVLPTPTVITTGNTICSGSTGSLTASGATAYTWSPSATLSASTGSVVQANPSATTLYTVTGAIGSCTNTATVTMSVNSTPTITATSGSICSGSNVSLTATGATNYTWSPSAGLSASSGSVVTAGPLATQTYTIIGEKASCTGSVTTTVSVTPTPTVSVSSGSVCSGMSVNLTASGAGTYFWAPSAGLSSVTGTVVSANPNATTSYTVIGANGTCTHSAVSVVTVVATPVVKATPGATLCSGSAVTLTVSGAASYVWSPSGSLSSATGSVVSANPSSNTTYTVVGSNGSCTNSAVSDLTVLTDVTVAIAPNVEICYGQSTVIYASGGTTYQWSPSTGLASPGHSVTSVSPLATTIYTVTVSKAGSCVKTSTIEVTVNPLPILNAGRDTSINVDNTLVLYGTGNVEVGYLSPVNGPPLSCNYCYSVMVNPQENTCYTLEGVNSYGCRNTDDICVVVTKDWNIYIPNAFTPNNDLVNDVFMPSGYGIKEIHLMIFDRWGVCIFKTDDGMNVGWDGKYKGAFCKEDVYVYKINFVTMSNEEKERTGHITVLPRIK